MIQDTVPVVTHHMHRSCPPARQVPGLLESVDLLCCDKLQHLHLTGALLPMPSLMLQSHVAVSIQPGVSRPPACTQSKSFDALEQRALHFQTLSSSL